MHWLFKLLIMVLGNAFALWLANKYVPGLVLNATIGQLIVIGLVLTLLNFFLKPILTLILGPLIVITLGLGIIVVNAIVLFVLPILANRIDFLHGSIMIQDVMALFLTTLIVSAVNLVIHLAP